MRHLRNCCLALLLGLMAPLLIWVGVGIGLYQRKKARDLTKQLIPSLLH